ncbi:hypothetical protein GOB93_15625 [Acetobacter musti]|uniref:Small CPxCG-related zinc finger protein n=1 Tax=Acetobacter musti TaxID=864732 RepID=A0ABX0JVQ3_9PROT|nr:hypothetical protein [Acetobacter musti]NHN86060.1 hypothetical protein [Acetobacter musti]
MSVAHNTFAPIAPVAPVLTELCPDCGQPLDLHFWETAADWDHETGDYFPEGEVKDRICQSCGFADQELV